MIRTRTRIDKYKTEFQAAFKAYFDNHDYSAEQLAKILGRSRRSVYSWYKGEMAPPPVALAEIRQKLGLDFCYDDVVRNADVESITSEVGTSFPALQIQHRDAFLKKDAVKTFELTLIAGAKLCSWLLRRGVTANFGARIDRQPEVMLQIAENAVHYPLQIDVFNHVDGIVVQLTEIPPKRLISRLSYRALLNDQTLREQLLPALSLGYKQVYVETLQQLNTESTTAPGPSTAA